MVDLNTLLPTRVSECACLNFLGSHNGAGHFIRRSKLNAEQLTQKPLQQSLLLECFSHFMLLLHFLQPSSCSLFDSADALMCST